MEFGEIICALRAEKGIYQKELADYLKVSIGTISNYEQGIHNPDFNTLCGIADFYEVSLDYLLGVEFKTKCNTLKQNKMSETNCNGDIPHLVSGIFYFPRF